MYAETTDEPRIVSSEEAQETCTTLRSESETMQLDAHLRMRAAARILATGAIRAALSDSRQSTLSDERYKANEAAFAANKEEITARLSAVERML